MHTKSRSRIRDTAVMRCLVFSFGRVRVGVVCNRFFAQVRRPVVANVCLLLIIWFVCSSETVRPTIAKSLRLIRLLLSPLVLVVLLTELMLPVEELSCADDGRRRRMRFGLDRTPSGSRRQPPVDDVTASASAAADSIEPRSTALASKPAIAAAAPPGTVESSAHCRSQM